MSLGDRCDEIVRLIDETLAEVAAEVAAADGNGLDSSPGGPPRWLEPLSRRALALTRWISPPDAGTANEAGRVA